MRPFATASAPWIVSTLLLFAVGLPAQTLARPGWAGSGLTAEPWWRNAVFYRVSPATFQDSDGDGKGDLRGIAQRMVYLQSLSVDAIVLQSPFDESGFDDLLAEASRDRIRLLVSLSAEDNTLGNARQWLTRGCGGIWLNVPEKSDATRTGTLVRQLRALTDSFPGQRVLVEDTSADPAAVGFAGAQLVSRTLNGREEHADAPSLQAQLAQVNNLPQGSAPVTLLLRGSSQASEDAQHGSAVKKMVAAALFLSRSATLIDAGQEIGRSATQRVDGPMQWTPSNITRPVPAEPAPAAPPKPRREDDYGSYVPYVAPKTRVKSEADELDALPGFSSIAAEGEMKDGSGNVAKEDRDRESVLNFYRRLSQLHHENAALRDGAMVVVTRSDDHVLAWGRKASAHAHTSAAILVACNFGDTSTSISFAPELFAADTRAELLPVLSSSPQNIQVLQRPTATILSPWSVLVLSSSR